MTPKPRLTIAVAVASACLSILSGCQVDSIGEGGDSSPAGAAPEGGASEGAANAGAAAAGAGGAGEAGAAVMGGGGFGVGGSGGAAPEPPSILSAFWGADQAFAPPGSALTCDELQGPRDGMPIVLSGEVDQATLAPEDIEIELESGAVRAPACVKLAPADEENEDRTILLIGDLGSADDPPSLVRIVGPLLLEDGSDANGAVSAAVVGVDAGPSLVLAELISALELGQPDDCPEGSPLQAVRTIWSGGVDGDMGAELTDADLAGFNVVVAAGGGAEESIAPIAFGDLNDGDNNVDVCVGDSRPLLRVEVAADTVTDPTNDWNDYTDADIVAE